MAKKLWKNVTEDEKMKMKQFVINNPPDTPLTPEYAASYLSVSTATLQKMRCEDTNGIAFFKPRARCIVYYKRDLDTYSTSSPAYRCTSEYTQQYISEYLLAGKQALQRNPTISIVWLSKDDYLYISEVKK